MRTVLSLLALSLLSGPGYAQAERYEFGQRLKAFEKQWDKTTDATVRKKALADLPKLTGLFFANKFGEAGRTLDEARWILEGKQPSDDEKWTQSLFADVGTRCVDLNAKELPVTVRAFYPVESNRPKSARVQFSLGKFAEEQSFAIDALPCKISVKFANAKKYDFSGSCDRPLLFKVSVNGNTSATRTIGMSLSSDAESRNRIFDEHGVRARTVLKADSLELSTAEDRLQTLADVSRGVIFETDIPAIKLAAELGAMIERRGAGKDYFTADRPGQFHLSIPHGKTRVPARLFVPKGLTADKPVPIVVALHGAGGSENLFFEGYGDGQIVKLCEKRGWLLVAPRSGLSLVGGGPPVGEIVDELAKRYPIDPKAVFVVGHSMGAMQTIDASQRYPGKFAGIAVFGGGGLIRKPVGFETLPTFIGVGDKDFALGGARNLKKSLQSAQAKAVIYKEYEGLEHLLICREALPDAFKMFDAQLK